MIGLLLGCFLFLAALYLQFGLGLEPCLLCILQRFILVLLVLVFLIAVLHHPKQRGIVVYGILTAIIAIMGIIAAGRQIWLQMQPPSGSTICVPGLRYMLETLPLTETISWLVKGSSACGVISWVFLGLSTAMWTLICFVLFLAISIVQIVRKSIYT